MHALTRYSAAASPLLLIGGWLLAESRQPDGFDPTRDAVSALAGTGATDPWIMTIGFVGAALAYLMTAAGLTEAALPGRLLIALSGVALLGVAAVPVTVTGTPAAHGIAATVAFVSLSVWPLFGSGSAAVLRPPVSVAAAVVMLGLCAWMLIGGPFGLAERAAIAAQSLWPLVVVVALRIDQGRSAGRAR